jgi:hypothetical protein
MFFSIVKIVMALGVQKSQAKARERNKGDRRDKNPKNRKNPYLR